MSKIADIARLLEECNNELINSTYPNVQFLHGQQVAYTKCIEILQQSEPVPCDSCRYNILDCTKEPCCNCKHNHMSYYDRRL